MMTLFVLNVIFAFTVIITQFLDAHSTLAGLKLGLPETNTLIPTSVLKKPALFYLLKIGIGVPFLVATLAYGVDVTSWIRWASVIGGGFMTGLGLWAYLHNKKQIASAAKTK